MVIRTIVAIGAAIGVVALARRAADNAVETRLDAHIEASRGIALSELKAQASALSRRRAGEFALRTLKKTAILAYIFAVYSAGHMTATGVRTLLVGAIALMMARDMAQIARPVWLALKTLAAHRWRPAWALKEFAAALSFEAAYQRSLTQMTSASVSPVLFVSSFTRQDVSKQIATAVADVARESTIREARPHVIFFIAATAIVAAVYSGFVLSAFHAIR
ncbi:MAG: hypothetical protein GC152_09655 [Alphaproteobacteria bacterium]|nr:hypothetical protein [Alphaproteobacteria bacterium]